MYTSAVMLDDEAGVPVSSIRQEFGKCIYRRYAAFQNGAGKGWCKMGVWQRAELASRKGETSSRCGMRIRICLFVVRITFDIGLQDMLFDW